MKEKLDLFKSLLDKAINSDNIKDLAIIEEDLQKLLEKRAKLGLGPKASNRVTKNVLENYDQKADDLQFGQLQDLIAKEVNRYLEKS